MHKVRNIYFLQNCGSYAVTMQEFDSLSRQGILSSPEDSVVSS